MSVKLPNPPGFKPSSIGNRLEAAQAQKVFHQQDPQLQLKVKKAWEVAFAPAKSLPMNLFMLWMSGNGVQIFSIIITVMMFWNPMKALFSIQQVFQAYEVQGSNQNHLLQSKLAYVFFQFCCIALGLWKCQGMGLLPTATSDWLAFMPFPTFQETVLL